MSKKPVILFDGVCNLCNGFVRFALPRDPQGVFLWAPLHSAEAHALVASTEHSGPLPDAILLVVEKRIYTKSEAVLRICSELHPRIWRLTRVFRLIPKTLRDWCYDVVAKNRYGWFGKSDQCIVPTEQQKSRFLAW